jgi:hypothetical protein
MKGTQFFEDMKNIYKDVQNLEEVKEIELDGKKIEINKLYQWEIIENIYQNQQKQLEKSLKKIEKYIET